jgi:hypothetical protein
MDPLIPETNLTRPFSGEKEKTLINNFFRTCSNSFRHVENKHISVKMLFLIFQTISGEK